MRRNALAYIVGIAVTMITIMLVQSVGHTIYPVAVDIDVNDSDAMAEFTSTLPIGAILFVAVSWAIGVIAGNSAAIFIGRLRPIYFSTVITSFVLAGAVTQLILVPHPTWFIPVSLAGIVAAGAVSNFLPVRKTA